MRENQIQVGYRRSAPLCFVSSSSWECSAEKMRREEEFQRSRLLLKYFYYVFTMFNTKISLKRRIFRKFYYFVVTPWAWAWAWAWARAQIKSQNLKYGHPLYGLKELSFKSFLSLFLQSYQILIDHVLWSIE